MKYAAACVHVKNEEDIIGEWMAFHRAVGFDHLIIIDNNSSDKTPEIVKNFPDQESVTYIFAPVGYSLDFYVQTLKTFGNKFHWMAFIDADEFLYPSNGGDIRKTLSNYEAAAGVGVFWQTYGSSKHLVKPEGRVIENFTRRSAVDFHGNRHIKCIVKPHKVWSPLSSHLFHMDGRLVDESWRDFHLDPPHGWFGNMLPTHDILRINHYHCLSRAQYEKKILRGYFGDESKKIELMREKIDGLWSYSDQNEFIDTSAQQYLRLMEFYGC